MNHVKLFENFNSNTLQPVDISKKGEVSFMFSISDEINIALVTEEESKILLNKINQYARKLNKSLGYETQGPADILMSRDEGNAYFYFDGWMSGSFKEASFEPRTAGVSLWIAGEGEDATNPSSEVYGSYVSVLKRGVVITSTPQTGSPYITETSLKHFIDNIENIVQ